MLTPAKCSFLVIAMLAAVVWVAVPQPAAQGYPEPSLAQRSWEFEFTFSNPKPLALRGADGVIKWYWVLPYKVVNETGEDRLFIPEITIATDQGQILTANRGVPALAFVLAKRMLGNDLLESPNRVVGKLLQGEDHAKESVAIWPVGSRDISRISIFVGGLSGETKSITDPETGERVLMRKTLMIDYELPGKPISPADQSVLYDSKRWIMR